MSDYRKLVTPYENELIENLKKFIQIDSVYDEESRSDINPFGKGVSDALNFIYELAIKDGFKATNYSNMVVEILVGEGDKNITIMAHADVVPEGTGWEHDPFDLYEKDGILYARGVADDKGPLLASYYALKALRDNNLLGDYQVRFLVGGNEESGSLGIEHYFHTLKKAQPTLGFSPDSNFPLIFAEKGIVNFSVSKEVNCPGLLSISGGVASNSVIEKCVVEVSDIAGFNNYLKNTKHNYSLENNQFIFHGVAAHGSVPWCGDNAGVHALEAISDCFNNQDYKHLIKSFGPLKGEGLDVYSESADMGTNSLNIGLISLENNQFNMVVNFRHVETVTCEEIISKIKQNSLPFTSEVLAISPLLYYPKDSVLVSTLLKAYQDETGDLVNGPLSTGGGTYAKEAENVVAFGMEFIGWDAKMHSHGECLKKEDLFLGMAIYARAIIELGKKL